MGAARAGFRIAGAVEWDEKAVAAHARNFPATAHLKTDVSALQGKELLQAAGLDSGELSGLIGGPPCQGFSGIGRHSPGDERNNLFSEFFRLVRETLPAFYMAENVPNIMHDKFKALRDAALSLVPPSYVRLAPIEVNASLYGAPTRRTRVFFIGYDPSRLHPLTTASFSPPADLPAVKVREALDGLPGDIDPGWQDEAAGWRRVGPYPETPFGEHLRSRVPEGVGDAVALQRLKHHSEVSGCLGTAHAQDTITRFSALGGGRVDRISRYVRLDLDGFCPTLRAGTGADHGSYMAARPIHPTHPRVITPREAARLQGFPDWFVFDRTKWHSFRQIGNSVSPLAAEGVLRILREHLREVQRVTIEERVGAKQF